MNEIRLLGEVPMPEYRSRLVPSGTMLQVIVAAVPLPLRDPDAVDSHGSGPLGEMMNPPARGANATHTSATAEHLNDHRSIFGFRRMGRLQSETATPIQ
jgi:hypothetical protein